VWDASRKGKTREGKCRRGGGEKKGERGNGATFLMRQGNKFSEDEEI